MANQMKQGSIFLVFLSAILTVIAVLFIIFGPKFYDCYKIQAKVPFCLSESFNIGFKKNNLKEISTILNGQEDALSKQEDAQSKQEDAENSTKNLDENNQQILENIENLNETDEEELSKSPILVQPPISNDIVENLNIQNEEKESLNIVLNDRILKKHDMQLQDEQLYEAQEKREIDPNIIPTIEVIRIEAGNILVIEGSGREGDLLEISADKKILGNVSVEKDEIWLFVSSLDEISPSLDKNNIEIFQNEDGSYKIFSKNLKDDFVNISAKIKSSDEIKNNVLIAPPPYLSIDEISINLDGNYSFSGRGIDNLTAQLFVDGKMVGDSKVENGVWAIDIDKAYLKSASQKVKIDFLITKENMGLENDIFASANIDFFDDEINSDIKNSSIKRGGGGNEVIVQEGDSLWSLAQRYYGAGYRYDIIFNANSDIINNPNWIYPKQKLKLP